MFLFGAQTGGNHTYKEHHGGAQMRYCFMVCAKWFRMRQVFPAISELGSGDPAVEVLDAFFILGGGGRCLALRYVLPLLLYLACLGSKIGL